MPTIVDSYKLFLILDLFDFYIFIVSILAVLCFFIWFNKKQPKYDLLHLWMLKKYLTFTSGFRLSTSCL